MSPPLRGLVNGLLIEAAAVLLVLLLAGCGPLRPRGHVCPPGSEERRAKFVLDCVAAASGGKHTLGGSDQDAEDVVIWCGNEADDLFCPWGPLP